MRCVFKQTGLIIEVRFLQTIDSFMLTLSTKYCHFPSLELKGKNAFLEFSDTSNMNIFTAKTLKFC